MIYSRDDVLKQINEIDYHHDLAEVRVFDNPHYEPVTQVIKTNKLFNQFSKLQFETNGGQDIGEFYIILKNGRELTIQIREIETVEEIEL